MLSGFGLVLILVTSKKYRTIIIGLDCSKHIHEVRYVGGERKGGGMGKRKSGNNSYVFGSSKWVDTEAIWEILKKKQVSSGGGNQERCFGHASFKMPTRIQTKMPSRPWDICIWSSRKGSGLE